MKAKIGLIINPIAGLGGKAGYKGSDCKEHLEHALQNGYQKCSAIRARECLRHILDIKQDCMHRQEKWVEIFLQKLESHIRKSVLQNLSLHVQTHWTA